MVVRWSGNDMDGKRACRIKAETSGDVFDKEQWDAMLAFMVDSMVRLENALKTQLKRVNQKLKVQPHGSEEAGH